MSPMSGCGSRRVNDRVSDHGGREHGGRDREAFIEHAQKTAAVFVIVLVVWAASGFGYFWPGWVLLFLGLKLGNHARRAYGGSAADDPDDVEALA